MLKQQSIDLVVDVFRHAPSICSDHRNASLLGLMNHEWRVLNPAGGNDNRINTIKHITNDVLIPVLGHPFNPFGDFGRQACCNILESRCFLSSWTAPDPQLYSSFYKAESANQIMDAFGRNVSADIAEREICLFYSLSI